MRAARSLMPSWEALMSTLRRAADWLMPSWLANLPQAALYWRSGMATMGVGSGNGLG